MNDNQGSKPLTVIGVIVLLALATALVTFGILRSEGADTRIPGLSLGGAIVGFLISFTAFTVAYQQIDGPRRRQRELRDQFEQEFTKLRESQQQERNKLLRSGDLPDGFIREVDERYKFLFARPQSWLNRNVALYNLSAPAASGDMIAASLQVHSFPRGDDAETFQTAARDHARNIVKELQAPPPVEETIHVGGSNEKSELACLKVTMTCYFAVRVTTSDQGELVYEPEGYVSKEKARAHFVPLYERASDPNRKGNLAEFANQRATCKRYIDVFIDSYTLDPIRGMSGSIERVLESVSLPAAAVGESDQASSSSLAGRGTEESGRSDYTEILLVNRVLVAVSSPQRDADLLLDFVDNVGDFPASSAIFHSIIQSVRFLS